MLIKRSIKGVLAGLICFAVMTLLAGVLLKLTPMPEIWGFGLMILAFSLTCFIASFYISGGISKAGILTGMIASSILILIIFIIISLIVSNEIKIANLLNIYYLIPIVFGIIGGVVGINLKK